VGRHVRSHRAERGEPQYHYLSRGTDSGHTTGVSPPPNPYPIPQPPSPHYRTTLGTEVVAGLTTFLTLALQHGQSPHASRTVPQRPPRQCLLRLAAGPQNDSGCVELHHMHSPHTSGGAVMPLSAPQVGRLGPGHQPRPKSPLAISRRTSSQSTRPSSRTRGARATRARTTRTGSRPRAASPTRSRPFTCPLSSPTHTSNSLC
jgi:hypothetical protein